MKYFLEFTVQIVVMTLILGVAGCLMALAQGGLAADVAVGIFVVSYLITVFFHGFTFWAREWPPIITWLRNKKKDRS